MVSSQILKNKKGQLIMGLIGGIAGLIILIIVSFLIVDTLNGANLMPKYTASIINGSSVTAVSELTGSLAATYSHPTCTVSQCVNNSNGALIPAANYTATSCNVRYAAATDTAGFNNSIWKCNFALSSDSGRQISTDGMIGNYTSGIDQVSAKIPTVLLVAAVVLLFGAIVLLVQRARQTTESSGGGL